VKPAVKPAVNPTVNPAVNPAMTATPTERLLVIIPAFNEEAALPAVLQEIAQVLPGQKVLVCDDCSSDATVEVARSHNVEVLSLPYHLGLGGCVQAGYKLAFQLGYDYVIRIDGDGQHDPRDIPKLMGVLKETGYEMVIGSRFTDGGGGSTSLIRGLGIRFFRLILRLILGKPVHDPTSGFVGVNRSALTLFAKTFPLEYPEIEALVVLERRAFRFQEVPCAMRARKAGRSTITAWRSIYYIVHVLLGVFVNVLKFDGQKRRRFLRRRRG
jgi:glycosyltransferase involved in cell wall biosynthesis